MSTTLAGTRSWPRQKLAMRHCLILCAPWLLGGQAGAQPPKVVASDVCVYGGTSGGVVAALQAARMGKRAVIAEPGRHLGGMTAGGLAAVDIGEPRSVGGIAREYFTRLAAGYGKTLAWDQPFKGHGGGPATGGAFAIEPHSAERLFEEMLHDAGVVAHFGARLATVRKEGARIAELVMEDGAIFQAKMFLDATYEGDLMARTGVSYTLTREGNAKYGETHNGIHYGEKFRPRTDHAKPGPNGRTPSGQGVWDRDLPLDPYVVPGDPKSGLLPLIDPGEPGTPGDPAPGIQAYCYRLCLTTNDNRIPIAPPKDYDPKRYEIVARFIAGCLAIGDDVDLRWFSKFDPLPNGKFDFNTATFGANLPGASWEWPEASYMRREQIAKAHEDYHRGLLHFLATDPLVPQKVREAMGRFGLPRDEFTDNGGWPHQIYVREARRMVSDLVMTEHHTFGREVAPKSIGLGSYGTDVHEIRRIAKDGVVIREGKIATGRDGAPPYPIGYGAIVPKPNECENLFVTFALSASHTAFASIRMEPVFMVMSQSAAAAACLAIDRGIPVQRVDYAGLRERLSNGGQVLEWGQPAKPPPQAPPEAGPVPRASRIPSLRDLPLLFADDSGVASSTGVVRTTHPAKTRNAPVIEADRPWEGGRVYIYGSVYADEPAGPLRLWYMSFPNYVLHATSRDGVNWLKPSLHLLPFKDATENNIVHRIHSPSVLLDAREPDPAKRYKLLGAKSGGYHAAFSADGLHWTAYPKNPVLENSDTITLTQDPITGEYLAFHKRPTKIRGFGRRAVWLARSRDFQEWGDPELVFAPDERDDSWANGPDQRTEVYNMSVYPHAAGFIGLPTIFRLTKRLPKNKVSPGQSPDDGPIDVQLAISADGRTWQRPEPRLNVIPRGAPGTFDGGSILGVSSTAAHVGEETWIYYTAMTTTHGGPIPPKRMSIGRAEWRRHGFVSLDAAGLGRVETKPLRLGGPSLIINADASRGQLRVALLEADGRAIAGYALDDSEPLRADATRWTARWRSKATPPTDRPLQIVVEMTHCRLFSISTATST
ncbi:MAG TPA: FAD-dependent oxidoreductase [Verrucomicrobiae bacterium]|nr:FAD-dependent oxidoreductase [Verrucomicrobiae bacterium]